MNPVPCPFSVEVVSDPEELAQARSQQERYQRNRAWLEAHAAEIFQHHRGRCVCVAGEELFVADTAAEAWARGAAAHPQDDGMFVRYIPVEKMPRVYAH